MSNSLFKTSKDLFLDVVDSNEYVQLDRVSVVYSALRESIKKPLKMILLYGRPGTGKSMMLHKLYRDLFEEQKVVLYQTPIIDEGEFLRSLAYDVYDHKIEGELNFTRFNELGLNYEFDTPPLVLLDEAQLYSPALMEKIRLISDSRKIKFIITLHKTEQEDLIAKEHFQTRIWESQQLFNATPSELKIYIQKKLLRSNSFDIANMFNDKNVKIIHKFTSGNYRDTNKLLYLLFDLYEWYEENRPSKISYTKISNKMIEMAAIQGGFLHV